MSGLRRAGVTDAAAIAEIDVRAWWHGYRSFLDEQRLSERIVEDQTLHWSERLRGGGLGETWALEVAGRIAGYSSFGPGGDPDAKAGTGELLALYVDPPAQGGGAGTLLLEHAHGRLAELGFDAATLWTFEANGLARAFYERHGWVLDPCGAGNERCEWWAPAVRYRRTIAS